MSKYIIDKEFLKSLEYVLDRYFGDSLKCSCIRLNKGKMSVYHYGDIILQIDFGNQEIKVDEDLQMWDVPYLTQHTYINEDNDYGDEDE